jgi:hypothetical protein
MAQPTISFRQIDIDHLDEPYHGGLFDTSHDRMIGLLDFPLETEGALTTFRRRVLTYMYRTAFGHAAGSLESASVSLSSTPDEEDSVHLDLTLTVDGDWDAAQKLTQTVLDRVSGWSREWTEEEQADYGRWIYFGVIPSEL